MKVFRALRGLELGLGAGGTKLETVAAVNTNLSHLVQGDPFLSIPRHRAGRTLKPGASSWRSRLALPNAFTNAVCQWGVTDETVETFSIDFR